jgi:ABC-type Fe3+/spermidine/putrescine transport system ATPase subunit
MLNGQIREIGAPETLYQRPASHDVMSFLGASNIIEGVGGQSSDQQMLVQCDGGLELLVAAPAPVDTGPVRLGIRPENFVIAQAEQTSEENSFEGVIEECIYKGAYADVYVRVNSGQLMNVHYSDQQNADGRGNNSISTGGSIIIGSRVRLSVRPENILIFA